MSELYRDYIDGKADEIINGLGGTITPPPANVELYRDFLDRKFDDVINSTNGLVKVKSFTYTGDGQTTRQITFTETPHIVIIQGLGYGWNSTLPIIFNLSEATASIVFDDNAGGSVGLRTARLSYLNDTLTIDGNVARYSMNTSGVTYTVYYI